MNAYPEYKQCDGDWINTIPVDWDIVRGKYLFDIQKRIAGELGHDVLSITQNGIKIKDTESGDGQLSMDYSKYQIVKPGDFAMNHMDLITGYVDISKHKGVTSPDYRVFTAKESDINSRYFLYVFQMGYTNKIFFKYGQGASHIGRWRLPTEEFNNFWFPYPPLIDRENIVNFLNYEIGRIDTLINRQQQLIILLNEKRQAAISHVVTKGLNSDTQMKESGIDWVDKVPEHWVIPRLSFVLKLQSGEAITSDSIAAEGSYLVYGGNGVRGYTSNFNCDGEYVLIGRQGALCGNINIAKGQFYASEHAIVVYPRKTFNTLYLSEMLKLMDLGQYSMSAAQPGISVERMNLLNVIMPPEDEQVCISKIIKKAHAKYDSLSKQCENMISLLYERRIALVSAAVTGQLDVRGWKPPSNNNEVNKEVAT